MLQSETQGRSYRDVVQGRSECTLSVQKVGRKRETRSADACIRAGDARLRGANQKAERPARDWWSLRQLQLSLTWLSFISCALESIDLCDMEDGTRSLRL